MVLDASSYPHILDLIIELADLPALIRLRGTSKAMLDTVNSRIFGHVFVTTKRHEWHLRSPTPPHALLPFLPILPPMVRSVTPAGKITYVPREESAKPLPPIGDPLRYTHTVDSCENMVGPNWSPLPEFPSLVRSRALHSPFTAREYVSYVHVGASRVVHGPFIPCDFSHTAIEWTVHAIFDAEWWGASVHDILHPDFKALQLILSPSSIYSPMSIHLVLHPPPLALATAFPFPIQGRGFERARHFLFPPDGFRPSHKATFTVVGLEKCPPQLLGLSQDMAVEDVIACVKALDQSSRDIRFVTMEEWTPTVHPLVAELPLHMALAARRK